MLSYEVSMLKIWDLVCEFDVLLSFAITANALDFRKPTIVKDKVINGLFCCKVHPSKKSQSRRLSSIFTPCYSLFPQVVNGRHPLQELTVDTFIPNDIVATDAIPVQVITGP